MLQRVPADPCEICSLCAGWVSDGAAVVLDKSSQVASGLDQIDAEAEDVRLDGEGETKIGARASRLSLLFLELISDCVNAVRLHVYAADVLVRRGVDGEGFR